MQTNQTFNLAPNTAEAKTLWLDRALADQPAAIRVKVLDFALKFGVGAEDDDFWILIAAIGFLHSIIETAPQQWSATLTGHTQELNQWTTSNLEVLRALTIKTETEATQAELMSELSHTLRALTKLLRGQQQHISKLSKISTTSESSLNDLRQSLNYRLNEMSKQIEMLAASIPRKADSSSKNLSRTGSSAIPYRAVKRHIAIGRWSGSLIPICLTASVILVAGLLWRGQQQQAQTLERLLLKVNSAECTNSAAPNNPACSGL